MRKLIGLAVCLMVVGCDFTVPLVKTSTLEIDRQLVGLWERTNADNKAEQILVLPFSAREYLVSLPTGEPDAAFAKGCLVSCAGKLFVQLEWIGTAKGKSPEDKRVYQLATYSVKGDELTVKVLDSSIVGKDVKSSEELAKAIEANKDNAELFREPMLFTKVNK